MPLAIDTPLWPDNCVTEWGWFMLKGRLRPILIFIPIHRCPSQWATFWSVKHSTLESTAAKCLATQISIFFPIAIFTRFLSTKFHIPLAWNRKILSALIEGIRLVFWVTTLNGLWFWCVCHFEFLLLHFSCQCSWHVWQLGGCTEWKTLLGWSTVSGEFETHLRNWQKGKRAQGTGEKTAASRLKLQATHPHPVLELTVQHVRVSAANMPQTILVKALCRGQLRVSAETTVLQCLYQYPLKPRQSLIKWDSSCFPARFQGCQVMRV